MLPPVPIHDDLRRARQTSAAGRAWLERLPDLIDAACRRWGLTDLGTPYEGGMSAWTAPVRSPSGAAVLKISWPHDEAATEAAALRWWAGSGTICLIAEDRTDWALLLESCRPGTPLRDSGVPNAQGLALTARLLRALWDQGLPPGGGAGFADMQEVCDGWAELGASRRERYAAILQARGADAGIVALGLELLRSLPRSATQRTLVHGDFNPGNILAAERSPFLVIDPKPMVGDEAYDPWQLVAQLDEPFASPDVASVLPRRIRDYAALLDLAPERIAAWGVARAVEGGLWLLSEGQVTAGIEWLGWARVAASMLR